jgi:hypothetical protein
MKDDGTADFPRVFIFGFLPNFLLLDAPSYDGISAPQLVLVRAGLDNWKKPGATVEK